MYRGVIPRRAQASASHHSFFPYTWGLFSRGVAHFKVSQFFPYVWGYSIIVRADYVASTKQIVIKPVSKTGRAYMRIIKYIDAHSDQPVNLKVKVLPYQVSATYLDSNGKHSLVCNVDNKKIDNGNKKQTVVKY